MILLFAFLGGLTIGIFSGIYEWSAYKSFALLSVLALILMSLAKYARADETQAMTALRATTLHLMNGTASVVKGKSGDRYILTNWHVCNHAKWKHKLFGTLPDGKQISGEVVKENFNYDLCAAKIPGTPEALELGDRLFPLEHVYTRGYPMHILTESNGRTGLNIFWSNFYEIGEVGECPKGSDKVRNESGELEGCDVQYESTSTTLFARPGSSGSPVVNKLGRLVGVISSWHRTSDYEAGMVTYNQVKSFLSTL